MGAISWCLETMLVSIACAACLARYVPFNSLQIESVDSQVSFSSDTPSQNSQKVKTKRKSRTPRKVKKKKDKQIKQEVS